ncbi:MAG: carboxypeptidase regulatory-like domain-containing protein [Bacteroidota bacterium]
MKQLLSIFIFLVGFTLPMMAQVTTASINGVATDADGQPLEAATIVAIHVPSGAQYGTTTRSDGRYTLPNLRVGGPYKITASFVGFETREETLPQLSLAQKLTLNFSLASNAQDLTEVIVTGIADPVINNERTGAATNISSTQLRVLPTISRSASDYTRLTPAASGNSFAGRNDQFNNFSLDGSIFNNPFGLDAATPGGQTDAQPISLDAIDQIQVSIAPYDVTQSGFTGAAVNAVTKSGTNNLSGTVFGFTRNQDLTGSRVNGNDIFVPELSQTQFGFSLGGPVVKNKLFFFVNAEVERREDLGSNFIALGAGGTDAENVSRVEASDLQAVSNVLSQRFGYQTGAYENYLHNTDNEKGIVKLDWNISNSHSLTATYNFLNASKQKPAHPSALGRRGPDATTLQFFNSGYQINNVIHSGLLELKSLFSNKFSNKLQVGFSAFRDTRDALSAPFPVVNINRDQIRYIVAGHEPFSINNALDQDVFQLTNNFNIYSGDHTYTIGFSFERFNFDNSFNLGVYEPFGVPYPGGTFGPGFNSTAEFIDFVNSGDMDAVVDHAQNTFDAGNWALAETNVGQLAAYIQDEWALNDRFTLTYGLRVDAPLYFDTAEKIEENIARKGGLFSDGGTYNPDITYYDEEGNPIMFTHTDLPEGNVLFSPRIGFNWDVNGDRSVQLRGGSGLFSGRFPFVWIGNQVANPDFFFYNMTRNDFRFPQVWRTNLGFDRKFSNGWVLTTDFIYTRDVNAMMVRNYGLNLPTARLNGVDNRQIYNPATDRSSFGNSAYVFTNTDLGRSINATIQLQRNWANGLYTSFGYNYLDARDASSIEAEISGDAFDRNPALNNVNQAVLTPSLYGNRHRFLGSAYKKFTYGNSGRWGTTISVFFEYVEGGRFTYTYSGDINNDTSPLNDLIYIPTDGEIDQMQFTGTTTEVGAQREALKRYIAQDDYLSENRGEYAETYAILSPWFSNWDLRILQDFNFKAGDKTNTIQFSIDVLNLGNLINSNWGVRQFPTNTQPIGVSLDENFNPTYSFDTTLQSTFIDDFSLLSRWQVQFGLRYIF